MISARRHWCNDNFIILLLKSLRITVQPRKNSAEQCFLFTDDYSRLIMWPMSLIGSYPVLVLSTKKWSPLHGEKGMIWYKFHIFFKKRCWITDYCTKQSTTALVVFSTKESMMSLVFRMRITILISISIQLFFFFNFTRQITPHDGNF